MSKIFELFGYPVDSWNEKAWDNLKKHNCPFMNAECDGGGNRFASGISLSKNASLRPFFDQTERIQAGVCSLQLHEGEQPWIVCPRRLLNFRGEKIHYQNNMINKLFRYANLEKGKHYKAWSEIKMKCVVEEGAKSSLFDYTFDYVITSCRSERLSVVSNFLGKTISATKKLIEDNGMTVAFRDGEYWYEDFPEKPLIIIEVMTSSTSGGNERNRTQVSQVFEDTIYQLAQKNVQPEGPGINYRQVWARMVSQLLVKSQIGKAWGGTTFWIIQDLLAQYISKTTALNLDDFISEVISEVNIVSGGYNDSIIKTKRTTELIDISDIKLFSGPVSSSAEKQKAFVDIIKLGCTPSIDEIWIRLVEKKPCASFSV